MKIKELINELGHYPEDLDVQIFDGRKSLHFANGDLEGNCDGIYPVKTELISGVDSDSDKCDWVAIYFDNEEFEDDGKRKDRTDLSYGKTKAQILSETFDEHDPIKFLTLMSHHTAKLMTEAHAADMEYGVDVTLNGKRIRVESRFEITEPKGKS